VWVVQEFVLARAVQLIVADVVIPLELVQDAIRILNEVIVVPEIHDKLSFQSWLGRVFSAATHMHQMFAFREARLSDVRSVKVQHNFSLASCVAYLTTGRLCKDPRDRLYAMLAMANDDLDIQPDYTSSAATISRDFTIRSLLKGELFVLHIGGIRPDSEAGSSSFAPDLGVKGLMTIPLNASELGFSASPGVFVAIKGNDAHTVSVGGV
jgi:hypothetical protein